MSRSVFNTVGEELLMLLEPLNAIVVDDNPTKALQSFLADAGWFKDGVLQDISTLLESFDGIISTVTTFVEDPIPDQISDVFNQFEQMRGLVTQIRGLGTSIAAFHIPQGDPSPPADHLAALAEDVANHLALKWLAQKRTVLPVLEVLGLVEWRDLETLSLGILTREEGQQLRFRLERLPDLLSNPPSYLLERLAPNGWPSTDHALETMMQLDRFLAPILGDYHWEYSERINESSPDPFRRADGLLAPWFNLQLIVPGTDAVTTMQLQLQAVGGDATLPSGTTGPGLVVGMSGQLSVPFSIQDWYGQFTVDADIGDEVFEITPNNLRIAPDLRVETDLLVLRDINEVLGIDNSGLSLGELVVSGFIALALDDNPNGGVAATLSNSRMRFSTEDFGSAIAKVVQFELDVPFNVGLAWSLERGLTLSASASLSASLGEEITIADGRVRILNPRAVGDVTQAPDSGVSLSFQADAAFDFNVFEARLDGFGLMGQLTFPESGGNLGQGDLRFEIAKPERLSMNVNLPAVNGGGFISINHEIGRYSGGLSLQVIKVGITAITVIDTQLPDDSDSFALFAALTLDVPEIPLGFGFNLTGLGGLIALNRGLNSQAIAASLKNGAIDALLFPDDPINDAPLLIGMIDDFFPILPGNTVISPMVEITWGSPQTLITAQLGVAISMPEGKIALLGSIFALLPNPDTPILVLNLDLIGEIDLPAGTMFMQASLYDSHLLGTIELSGDMGLFLATKGQRYFLMSVGGYHPGFQPPAVVPPILNDLRRMTAVVSPANNVVVTLTCYFAVTSNTVQFGASVDLLAEVRAAGRTYLVIGYFGFNVLLRFSPFAIIADFEAGVGIYRNNRELFGVHFAALLEGPDSWYVAGQAQFKFFGLNVSVDVEFGSRVGSEPKPLIPLRTDIEEALRQPSAWRAAETNLVSALTFLALDGDQGTDWLKPDAALEVVQSIAPLNRIITAVGQGLPASGDNQFQINSAGIGGIENGWEALKDWFAPAQFELMTPEQKLARASFEEMDAGVVFGKGGLQTVEDVAFLGRQSALTYEDVSYGENDIRLKIEDNHLTQSALSRGTLGAAAQLEPSRIAAFTVNPPQFVVVSDETAQAIFNSDPASQFEALAQAIHPNRVVLDVSQWSRQ